MSNFRILEIYKRLTREATEEDECIQKTTSKSSIPSKKIETTLSTISSTTGTETERPIPDEQKEKLCIEYLLGLEDTHGEAEALYEGFPLQQRIEESQEFKLSSSKAMREAQMYLIQHRIFDFFQLIVTHLISASPENPITFIMEYLNKCLLYRSQYGKPPILYEKKHLEQLFNMMDRMGNGFIEMNQYKRGIQSLGICDFNQHPKTNFEGHISKCVFIDEAYRAQVFYFNELVGVTKTHLSAERSTATNLEDSMLDATGSYFMPSALFKPLDKTVRTESRETDIVENNEGH